MKINGYKIQYQIQILKEERELKIKQFDNSVFQFDGELEVYPHIWMKQITEAEEKIVQLQLLQTSYNQQVKVDIPSLSSTPVTLLDAVKRSGGAARIASLWRDAARKDATPTDRYWASQGGGKPGSRSKEHEYANRVTSIEDCLANSHKAKKTAAGIQAAIKQGNAVEIDMNVSCSLFE